VAAPPELSESEQSAPNQPGRHLQKRARHAPRPLQPLMHSRGLSRSQATPTKPAWHMQRSTPRPSRKHVPLWLHSRGQRAFGCGISPLRSELCRDMSRSACSTGMLGPRSLMRTRTADVLPGKSDIGGSKPLASSKHGFALTPFSPSRSQHARLQAHDITPAKPSQAMTGEERLVRQAPR